jgi:hypothetical protein
MNVTTTTATPAEIDAEINRIDAEIATADANITQALKTIERVDNVKEGSYDSYYWTPEKRAGAVAQVEANIAAIETLRTEAAPLHARYAAERWTRYYLVNNSNGHVHTHKGCRTCFTTTQFIWLTDESGRSHEDLTGDAGELSCAECFPNLPAEIMARKTRIEDPAKRKTRLEREAAKAERDAKKLAKALLPDGSPLRVEIRGWSEKFTTEVAARNWIIQELADGEMYMAHGRERSAVIDDAAVEIILAALAAKHGVTVDQERETIAKKVAARIKRNS